MIWDLDGTLVRLDVSREQLAALKSEISERFRPFDFHRPFSPLLPTLEEALKTASAALPAAESEAFRIETYALLDRWEADAIGTVDVVPHTAKLLGLWSACAVPMALVTNNGPSATRRALSALVDFVSALGMPEPGFAKICVRGPSTPAKPDPAGFREAFRALCTTAPCSVTDVVVIGDGTADWQAATALARNTTVPVWVVVPLEDRLAWAEHQSEAELPGMTPGDFLAALGLPAG